MNVNTMLSKKEIIALLKKKNYDSLTASSNDASKVIRVLISLSYDKDDVISWRAMEAIGLLTSKISPADPDLVRNIVNRLLWMIRDESGGIGWSVPEILGEIVRNNPGLCADIAPIIASFHEELMLTAGVLRAVGRIGRLDNYFLDHATPIVLSYLGANKPLLRGCAAWAAGELRVSGAVDALEQLRNDAAALPFYEGGELHEKTVGELAAEALRKLQ